MPSGIEEVLRLLEHAFSSLNITYVVGGSIASSIHGIPRSTNHVDILAKLEPHDASAIVNLLVNDFYIDQDRIMEAILRKESFSMMGGLPWRKRAPGKGNFGSALLIRERRL